MIQIIINDKTISVVDGATLAEVLESQGIKTQGIATAVNGVVISSKLRDSHIMSNGDKIMIVKAFYGG